MRLFAVDYATLAADFSARLAAILAIYRADDTLSASITAAEAHQFLTTLASNVSAKLADVENRLQTTQAAWLVDMQENENWTARVYIEEATLDYERALAQNYSAKYAYLTAQEVLVHHTLSSTHYCFGSERLDHRLTVLGDLSFIIEDVHELVLLSAYNDLVYLVQDKANCLQNATLCTWNATLEAELRFLFNVRKLLAWQLIGDAEEFKAYLDLFGTKVAALVQLKCIDEKVILLDLAANVAFLENGFKADLEYLRSHTINATKLAYIFDFYMDFVREVEAINASVTTSALGLSLSFGVISDLINLDDTLVDVAERFCIALKAFIIAHFAADVTVTGHVCNPLSAVSTTKKRQLLYSDDNNGDNTETNPINDPFTISTQDNVVLPSTPTTTPTSGASVVMVGISAVVAGVATWLL